MSEVRVAEELAIRSLVARYSDAVARRDERDWAATWAQDSEWHIFGRPTQGRDEIVSLFSKLIGSLSFVLQLPSFGIVELDETGGAVGPEAKGRWYITEYAQSKGEPLFTLGVYHDRYTRQDGGWRFARRRFDVLYMGPPGLSGAPTPFPTDL